MGKIVIGIDGGGAKTSFVAFDTLGNTIYKKKIFWNHNY